MRELTPLEYLQVQARKQRRPKAPKPPRIEPDALCYAYDRPKAAFFTEGKAYAALIRSQERRAIDGSETSEQRFYKCVFKRSSSLIAQDHFHLTSMTESDLDRIANKARAERGTQDVSAD